MGKDKGVIRRLFAAMIMGLCVVASAQAETIIIQDDFGGNVLQYQARRKELAKADLVRIQGRCDSACTIFITLPNACVGRKAIIGIHGASPKTGVPNFDYYLDMQVGQFYRGEMRRRFETKWRFLLGSKNLHFIDAERLVELDPLIKICPPAAKRKPKPKP
jgi:hypothetical protein